MELIKKRNGKGYLLAFYLLVSLLIFSCFFRCNNPLSGQEKEIVLRLEPGENNPRNSEGDFIRLRDGRILFVYTHFYGESGSDFGQAYLAGRFSGDNGKTWTLEDTLILPNEGVMNTMGVSLLRLDNGQIALFYGQKNSISDSRKRMRISNDEARTWSEPILCVTDMKGYFVVNNDRFVQLKNGRMLMPTSLHKTPDTEWSPGGTIYCYYSDNHGKTWKRSKQVPNPNQIVLQEPGIVALKDNSLMMFMRTTSGVQYFSYSKTNGETWSAAEPSRMISPCSPASIERIPSTGDLVAVWNNNTSTDKVQSNNRTPLNIAISKNEGKTWQNIKTLESDPDGHYCYTAIEFVDDHILLGYCAGNRPKGTGLSVLQITRLDLDWLYK